MGAYLRVKKEQFEWNVHSKWVRYGVTFQVGRYEQGLLTVSFREKKKGN